MAVDKMREDQLHAVWFAAGTAALIACIERTVLMVSLFAHWRVWAFLALNLLLLAILFTSKSQLTTPSIKTDQEDSSIGDSQFIVTKKQKKNKTTEQLEYRNSRPLTVSSTGDVCGGETTHVETTVDSPKVVVVHETSNGEDGELSKEELNERADAFIAKFRQHLVSDAKGKRFE